MHCTEYRFSLDIKKTVSQVSLNMKKGETGRSLLIHMTKGGFPWHVSNRYTATFKTETPAGELIEDKCSINRCMIQYAVPDVITGAVGEYTCEIEISDADGSKITGASFKIIVERIAGDEDNCMDPGRLPFAEVIDVDGAALSETFHYSTDGESGRKVAMKAMVGEDVGRAVVDEDTRLVLRADASDFGDAAASDVLAGRIFTSAAGLKRKGTHQCTGGASISATDDGDGNVVVSMTGVSVVSDDDGDIVIE